jgi:hypothetical protein
MGNSINTDRRKTGGEELGYSSGLRKLEAGSGFCLRLPFHRGTSFAGDLGGLFQHVKMEAKPISITLCFNNKFTVHTA